MANMKHTPGPWECDSEFDDEEPIRIYGPGQRPVAVVPDEFGPQPGEIDIDAANARMIAAAPTMLAALLGMLDDPRMPIDLFDEVTNAVLLALGGSWGRVADDAGEVY